MPESASDQRKPHARMDLTQGPIARTLLTFSLPVLGTSVLQALNGSINAIWVSRLLGKEALAATSNATLIMLLLLFVVFGVGMASTILVGQAVGANDLVRAKKVVGTTATFFLALSVFTSALGYAVTDQILHWMATPESVRPMAEAYLRVVFLAMPVMYLFAFVVMVQRGAGDARTPFMFMTLASLLDITLNPLLITGFGPFPRLGIAGSGLSLLLSQAGGMIAMLVYLYWRKADLRITRTELHYFKPDRELLWTTIVKGLPMGAQMGVISTSGIVMLSFVNGFGAELASAYALATQLWIYLQMPAMSIGGGVSAMVAQNIGANRWDRVEQSARAGVLISVLLTGAFVLVLALAYPAIAQLFFSGQHRTIAMATHINAITSWTFILFSITFVLFGVVRATGAVTPPLFILMISLYGVRIGFAKLFAPVLGPDAIWWSFPASTITSAALALAYYRWGGWRNARMQTPAREAKPSAA